LKFEIIEATVRIIGRVALQGSSYKPTCPVMHAENRHLKCQEKAFGHSPNLLTDFLQHLFHFIVDFH